MDAGVVLSLVGVAGGGTKIVHDDVLMDVVMLCLDDLLGEFRDGKLNVFVHSARLRPMFAREKIVRRDEGDDTAAAVTACGLYYITIRSDETRRKRRMSTGRT